MPRYNLVRHIMVSKYDQSGSTPMQAEMLFSQESLIALFCHRAKQGEKKKNRVRWKEDTRQMKRIQTWVGKWQIFFLEEKTESS